MILQELEGFTFSMALDLNMGYYTIILDPESFLGENIPTRDFQWVLQVLLTFFKVKCRS